MIVDILFDCWNIAHTDANKVIFLKFLAFSCCLFFEHKFLVQCLALFPEGGSPTMETTGFWFINKQFISITGATPQQTMDNLRGASIVSDSFWLVGGIKHQSLKGETGWHVPTSGSLGKLLQNTVKKRLPHGATGIMVFFPEGKRREKQEMKRSQTERGWKEQDVHLERGRRKQTRRLGPNRRSQERTADDDGQDGSTPPMTEAARQGGAGVALCYQSGLIFFFLLTQPRTWYKHRVAGWLARAPAVKGLQHRAAAFNQVLFMGYKTDGAE